ncbi:MAG: hypothetical protein AMXMBFR64_00770 [Myxococcales bacterium]
MRGLRLLGCVTVAALVGSAQAARGDARALKKDLDALGACAEATIEACPALARLVEAGDVAVPALAGRLVVGDDAARVSAVKALGFIGSEAATDALLAALRERRVSTDVLVIVAETLGRSGAASAVEPLVALLASDEPRDKLAAITAMLMLRAAATVEPLIHTLSHHNPNVQVSAATALGVIGDPTAAAPLTELLGAPTVWPVRVAVVEALGRIGEPWTAGAVEPMLAHPRPEVRRAAALGLGELGATWAGPALVRAVSDPDTVGEAAIAVGKLGVREAVPMLVRAAREPLTDEAQAQVMAAIGGLGSAEVLPDLEPLIQSRHERLVVLTAEAMGRIGHPDAADALVSLLDSREKGTREIAVWALEQVTGELLGQDAAAWRRWLAERDARREGTP